MAMSQAIGEVSAGFDRKVLSGRHQSCIQNPGTTIRIPAPSLRHSIAPSLHQSTHPASLQVVVFQNGHEFRSPDYVHFEFCSATRSGCGTCADFASQNV